MTLEGILGDVIFQAAAPVQQLAGTIRTYTWSNAVSNAYASPTGEVIVPLPSLVLFPGYRILVSFIGFLTGDSINSAVFTVVRFPTGPQLEEVTPLAPLDLSQLGAEPVAAHG